MTSENQPAAGAIEHCDVLVIGCGPAGGTVAPLLREHGHRVVVLEKERYPRFHIGESLLPANLPLFERLGVADEMRAIGVEKYAAEFHSPHHDHVQPYLFGDAWDKSMPHAYQVLRADFDKVLMDNARRRGAEVIEGCRVSKVSFEQDGSVLVDARHDDGRTQQWRARFLVDASGRDTFLANRFRTKHRNPHHTSAAVFGHFAGAKRNPGAAAGNISLFWFEHGWFWFIPMRNDVTSVGVVTWPYYMKTRGERSLEQFLRDQIANCPPLAERLREAELVHAVEGTGNFSYTAEHNHGDNYLMLGDAFAFIDPVFSSGVWLAMQGGVFAAEAVNTCLQQPAQARQALKTYDRRARRGPKIFSWFIYRMTNPIMRDFFMGPKNIFRVKEALLSVLAGDIYGKTPIWPSVWVFKLLYYSANFLQPRRAWAARQRRRFNIRPQEDGA